MTRRLRLDQLCVERGLAPTRHKAQALILAGQVLVDDHPVSKAGSQIADDAALRLRGEAPRYVSRGGLKLEALLEACQLDVNAMVALDVGASTGGFTDCLLQHGAEHVIAVDVGYGQLAWKLRSDPRVTCVERQNARYLDRAALSAIPDELWPPKVASIDVSFISLTLVLPAIAALIGGDNPLLCLVKPQFEATREEIGKHGVIRGEGRKRAIDKVLYWAKEAGYTVDCELDCPLPGPKGNVEFLVQLRTPKD